MYYQTTIVVPPQTPENEPIIEKIGITRGVIRTIQVAFPAGACALCHVMVFDKGWQLVPWTPGESLAWDNYVFNLIQNYPMVAEPYELTVVAWNDDDSYEHKIFVGVQMDEGEPEIGLLEFIRELQRVA